MDILKLADWTEDDAVSLANTLQEPHMRKLRLILTLKAVPPSEVAVVPGIDLHQLQAHAYSHSQGMSKIIEFIDRLLPQVKPKPLGQPFRTPAPPEIPPNPPTTE